MSRCIPSAALLVLPLLAAAALAQRAGDLRMPDKLKEGEAAPDFTLKSPDGKQEVTLSGFRGKKPVALVFGSYT